MIHPNQYHHSHCYSILELKGEKTTDLLQNILTSDIQSLTHHSWQFSALCSHQGRVLSLFRLLKISDIHYLIQLPQSVEPFIKTELQKYAQFSQVELSNLDEKFNQFIVFNAEPIKADFCFQNLLNIFNIQIVLVEKNQDLSQFISNQLSKSKAIETGSYKDNLMTLKIPEIEKQCSGSFIAQMLDLENLGGLCFTKGCYIGQEVIARLHYKGRLTKKIKMLSLSPEIKKINPNLKVGEQVLDKAGHKIGILVQKGKKKIQLVAPLT